MPLQLNYVEEAEVDTPFSPAQPASVAPPAMPFMPKYAKKQDGGSNRRSTASTGKNAKSACNSTSRNRVSNTAAPSSFSQYNDGALSKSSSQYGGHSRHASHSTKHQGSRHSLNGNSKLPGPQQQSSPNSTTAASNARSQTSRNGASHASFRSKQQDKEQLTYLKYKTTLCRHFEETQQCSLGDACSFAHGEHEKRNINDVSNWSKETASVVARPASSLYLPSLISLFVYAADARELPRQALRRSCPLKLQDADVPQL